MIGQFVSWSMVGLRTHDRARAVRTDPAHPRTRFRSSWVTPSVGSHAIGNSAHLGVDLRVGARDPAASTIASWTTGAAARCRGPCFGTDVARPWVEPAVAHAAAVGGGRRRREQHDAGDQQRGSDSSHGVHPSLTRLTVRTFQTPSTRDISTRMRWWLSPSPAARRQWWR